MYELIQHRNHFISRRGLRFVGSTGASGQWRHCGRPDLLKYEARLIDPHGPKHRGKCGRQQLGTMRLQAIMLVYVGNVAGVHFITAVTTTSSICFVLHSRELHILEGFEQLLIQEGPSVCLFPASTAVSSCWWWTWCWAAAGVGARFVRGQTPDSAAAVLSPPGAALMLMLTLMLGRQWGNVLIV